MIVLRFLLRFLIVPFGASVAMMTAMLVIAVAHWNCLMTNIPADTTASDTVIVTWIGTGFALLWSFAILTMMATALIGALIAEGFAIRSWIFRVLNGGLAARIGWATMASEPTPLAFYDNPVIVIGAGIAAGFAYWVVAGWNAGFWKPVFPSPAPPAAAA